MERTFAGHERHHELHGITVVVETSDGELWVGRCHDIDASGVTLRDADVHRSGADGAPDRAAWLDRARAVGVFPNHRRTLVEAGRVESVRRLVES